MNKLKLLITTLLLLGLIRPCLSQDVNGCSYLENCFQLIYLDGGEYTFLDTKMRFGTGGTSNDLDFVNIIPFDKNGNKITYDYAGLVGEGYYMGLDDVLFLDENGEIISKRLNTMEMRDTQGALNSKWFAFDENIGSAEITSITLNDDGTLQAINTTKINFVGVEDIIDIDLQKCRTFEDFHLDLNTTVDGFCGDLKAFLSTHPRDAELGWKNISQQISVNGVSNVSDLQHHCNLSEDNDMTYRQAYPSGCENYHLELRIIPCRFRSLEDCTDHLLKFEVKICCKCEEEHTLDDSKLDQQNFKK